MCRVCDDVPRPMCGDVYMCDLCSVCVVHAVCVVYMLCGMCGAQGMCMCGHHTYTCPTTHTLNMQHTHHTVVCMLHV